MDYCLFSACLHLSLVVFEVLRKLKLRPPDITPWSPLPLNCPRCFLSAAVVVHQTRSRASVRGARGGACGAERGVTQEVGGTVHQPVPGAFREASQSKVNVRMKAVLSFRVEEAKAPPHIPQPGPPQVITPQSRALARRRRKCGHMRSMWLR